MVTKKKNEKKKEDGFSQLTDAPSKLLGFDVPQPPTFVQDVQRKKEGVSKPSDAPPKQPDKTHVYYDEDTGKPSGVRIGGSDFLISEKEIENILQKEQAKKQAFPLARGAVAEQQRAILNERLRQDIGQIDISESVERDEISRKQAARSALTSAGIGAASGVGLAAAGAALAPTTAGTSLIPGAIATGVGAITGFTTAYTKNIKEQRQDIIKGEAQNLMKNEQNLLKIVMLANRVKDPAQLIELRTLFDEGMGAMDTDYARLKLETEDDLTLWLGQDGHKQLEKYITFNQDGGMRDILVFQMELALSNPSESYNDALQAQLDASIAESIALGGIS